MENAHLAKETSKFGFICSPFLIVCSLSRKMVSGWEAVDIREMKLTIIGDIALVS